MATNHEADSREGVFGEQQTKHYTRQLERQLEGEMKSMGLSGEDIERLLSEVEDNNKLAREIQTLREGDSGNEYEPDSGGVVEVAPEFNDGNSNAPSDVNNEEILEVREEVVTSNKP